jgi:mono/diheme cytochrome c family protein
MEPTSTAAGAPESSRTLITALVVVAAVACVILLIWMLGKAQVDPYVQATLNLQGTSEHGGQLFRINCAGCHGLAGQGLLGPKLTEVSSRLSDQALIHQIVSGDTPPMPSFQMEPQSMADLLAHLHNLQ